MTVGGIVAIIVSVLAAVASIFGYGRSLGRRDIIESEADRDKIKRDALEVEHNEIDNSIDNARNDISNDDSIIRAGNEALDAYRNREK